jgi:DNA-binding transcriptional LysR family regulator
MLDPRQLLLLQAVARSGSYSAAARELGYTQPAITYQMRQLERAAGVVLAVRIGRHMRLTPAGETLLAHTDRILAAMRAAEHELASIAGVPSGVVRLTAFPSSCATIVPRALAEIERAHPAMAVELSQAEVLDARDAVRAGTADLAVCYRIGSSDVQPLSAPGEDAGLDFVWQPLTVEHFKVLLPAGHALAHRKVLSVADLADENWILASTLFAEILANAAREAGFVPRHVVVADDYVAMQAMVANGLGIALLPELALAAHRNPHVVDIGLRGWPERHIGVELWPDMLRLPAIDAVITALQNAVSSDTPH